MPEDISEANHQAGPGLPLVLPNQRICRTRPIGSIKAFATCLVNEPCTCAYATSSGEGYFMHTPTMENVCSFRHLQSRTLNKAGRKRTYMTKPIRTPDRKEKMDALRVLPHPKVCRAKPIGRIVLFGRCLVDCPIECSHAFNFGTGYICRHPNWKDFVKP